MSLGFIENQPVIFVPTGENPEDLPSRGFFDFAWPIMSGGTDKTYVQFNVSPIAGSSNLVSPVLGSGTTGWTSTGSGTLITGLATIGDGSTGNIILPPMDNLLVVGLNYQLTITVSIMFGTANIYNGATLIGTVQSSGTYVISFEAVNDDITVKVEDSDSYIEFTDVSIYPLPEDFAFGILDSNLIVYKVVKMSEFPDYFTLSKNTLTVYVDWTELEIPNGCWYIGITDPETNTCQQMGLYNSSFNIDNDEDPKASIDGWTGSHATQVTFQSFNASITSLNTEIQSILSDSNKKLCANKQYKITVNANKSGATNVTLRVNSGSSSASQVITSTTAANYVLYITPTFADYLRVQNDNNTSPYGATNVLIVNSVTVELVNITDWSFEAITPYPYNIHDIGDNLTKVIGLFNNEDGLGFCFEESGFFPQMRIEAKIINRKYNIEREDENNDVGTSSVMFAEGRKRRFLRTELLPNIAHDFLFLAPMADHFYVDETEYFVDSDKYEPSYDDSLDNFAFSELEISNPTQLIRNINSGLSQQPSGNDGEIITPRDSEIIIEPATGDRITAR